MGRDPGHRLARLDADPLWARPVGLGLPDDFRHRLFGPSEAWDPVAPFVAHRHLKRRGRNRHTPHVVGPDPRALFVELCVRELADRRGFGEVLAADPLLQRDGLRSAEYRRSRDSHEVDGGRPARAFP